MKAKTTRKRASIGVMSQRAMRARAVAIANREYRPKADEPSVWFSSMDSVVRVLGEEKGALRRIVASRGRRAKRSRS